MYSWNLVTGDDAPTLDAQNLRRALGAFPTGVCLVTTVASNGKREGMTINSFSSVSLMPPLVLWSIRDAARSADVFLEARHFVLSILSAGQRDIAEHFATPSMDKFAACEDLFDVGLAKCPRLRNASATFECSTFSRHPEGDHTILVGRVREFTQCSEPPLMFHSGRMGSLWQLAQSLAAPPA